MGSERVLGGVAAELEVGGGSERVVLGKRSSVAIQKDKTNDITNPKRASWDYISSAPCLKAGSQHNNPQGENGTKHLSFRKGDPVVPLSPRSDELHLGSKCKKLAKYGSGSVSGCSKRPRLFELEDSASQVIGKGQIPKGRVNCGGKQSERRSSNFLTRTKYDSFSLRNGTTIFNSSTGGHTVLGYYGLKPELYDITKQVNELSLTEHSLEELLDNTSPCQNSGNDQRNNGASTNEKLLHSIKTVCSILMPWKPSQNQISFEIDGNVVRKVSPGTPSTSCTVSSARDDRSNKSVIDQPLQNKGSCNSPEGPVSALDFQLCHPNVILERLVLPPSEDLESLLIDAVKPLLSLRDGIDPRSGKRILQHSYLPPFSWSHTFGGHCKSATDALKLSTSRSSCQGSRWTRIGNTPGFSGILSDEVMDFSKFTYNNNLVPRVKLTSVNVENGPVGPSLAVSGFRGSEMLPVERLPSSIIAARTLCDIARQPLSADLSRLLILRKKPLEKALKARKFNNEERSEKTFSRPRSLLGYESMASHADQAMPLKRSKLAPIDKKKHVSLKNGVAKEPLIWSAPKSCRSSAYRAVKDTTAEHKHSSSEFSKPSCALPLPVRILDKASSSQQKPRKVAPIYWDR